MRRTMSVLIVVAVAMSQGMAGAGYADRGKVGDGGDGVKHPGVLDALKWLARHQNDDGGWSVTGFDKRCGRAGYAGTCAPNQFAGDAEFDVGVTGLSLLAFLSAGFHEGSTQSHDSLSFGDVVRKGFKHLIDRQDAEGCLAPRRGEYMYNHLVAAFALTEAYALTGNATYKAPAQKAVDFTVAAQNPGLGWRYSPKCGDNDSSVTGWAMMSLKSAEGAKLNCPKTVYDGAMKWYDSVTISDGYYSVGYVAKVRGKVSIRGVNDQFDHHETLSAIATVARIFAGQAKKNPSVTGAMKLLAADEPSWDGNKIDFYYWYYGTLAMLHGDGPTGDRWTKWSAAVKNALVEHQNKANTGDKAGSWEPSDRWACKGGRVYATAINCLTLQTASR